VKDLARWGGVELGWGVSVAMLVMGRGGGWLMRGWVWKVGRLVFADGIIQVKTEARMRKKVIGWLGVCLQCSYHFQFLGSCVL